MYPEKFAELAEIVRGLAPDAAEGAIGKAAGELLVGLGQCESEEDAVTLADRVFSDILGKNLTPAEANSAGAVIYGWRRGWTDLLY